MSITKVNGTIEEPRGIDGGRIKVISFKSNKEYITDPDEIKKYFPPHGFVFSPHLFKDYDVNLYSLVEFSVIPALNIIENGDEFILDNRRECELIGFRVLQISENIFVNEYSINPISLGNYFQEESSAFYIENNKSLYGLFKSSNGEILPKTGMEVNKYNISDVTLYSSGDRVYLLKQPSHIIERIDCMTSSQLADWLRSQIKNLQLNIDLGVLKKSFESKQLQALDHSRMQRALSDLT